MLVQEHRLVRAEQGLTWSGVEFGRYFLTHECTDACVGEGHERSSNTGLPQLLTDDGPVNIRRALHKGCTRKDCIFNPATGALLNHEDAVWQVEVVGAGAGLLQRTAHAPCPKVHVYRSRARRAHRGDDFWLPYGGVATSGEHEAYPIATSRLDSQPLQHLEARAP